MKRFFSLLFILTFFCTSFSYAADSDFTEELEAFIEKKYKEGVPGLSDAAFAEVITRALSNPEQARKYFAMSIEVETQIPEDGSSRHTEGLRTDMLLSKGLITEDARSEVLVQNYFIKPEVEKHFSLDEKRRMWDAAIAAHKRSGGEEASLAIEHRLKDIDLHGDMMTIVTESMVDDAQMGPVAKGAVAQFISSGGPKGGRISDAYFPHIVALAKQFAGIKGADDAWGEAIAFIVKRPVRDSKMTKGERMDWLNAQGLSEQEPLVADYSPDGIQAKHMDPELLKQKWGTIGEKVAAAGIDNRSKGLLFGRIRGGLIGKSSTMMEIINEHLMPNEHLGPLAVEAFADYATGGDGGPLDADFATFTDLASRL